MGLAYTTNAMFTGIIQARGRVALVERRAQGGMRLMVSCPQGFNPLPAHGDSVCVSGVCLTVISADHETLGFDVVAETLAKTTLGDLQQGSGVNLEAAVTPTTPMGGHFVQGHVDGGGRVTRVHSQPDQWRITVEPETPELMRAVVPKGSVALEGVSLTVAAVHEGGFDVALIPATLGLTTLGSLQEGDRVNIETDMVAKTITHWLERRFAGQGDTVTMQTLREAGFLLTLK